MKKRFKVDDKTTKKKKTSEDWKKGRNLILNSFPVEVDLENRQILFKEDIKEQLNFEFATNNVDHLIHTYVSAKDSEHVVNSLTQAKTGLEQPIRFDFVHPITAKTFRFEYQYEIVYVKYASTRLKGVLVNVRAPKSAKKEARDN